MLTAMQTTRWHTYADAAALDQAATAWILDAARQAIDRSGAFHLVLAGGNTPRRVYQVLARAQADWSLWHIWFGDERCLPPDHPERNSRMAADVWLDHVAIPAAQIHVMPTHLPAIVGADETARLYEKTLLGQGDFDLVLLGLGEDAHTASLFPGHEWGTGAAAADVLAVFDAPKPPPERVSLSARRLAAAREVVFLVSGEGKREAVTAWRAGHAIPAAAIAPAGGVDILIDFA
jgi:6-phosphogluconolactonase